MVTENNKNSNSASESQYTTMSPIVRLIFHAEALQHKNGMPVLILEGFDQSGVMQRTAWQLKGVCGYHRIRDFLTSDRFCQKQRDDLNDLWLLSNKCRYSTARLVFNAVVAK